NSFGELLAHDHVKTEDIEQLLAELVNYAGYHFDEEEKLMAQKAVEPRIAAQQKEDHQSFLQEISLLLETDINESEQTGQYVFDFLVNWLTYHVLGSDMSMIRQLVAIDDGKTPLRAYQDEEKQIDAATAMLLQAMKNLFHQVTLRNKQLVAFNLSLEEKVAQRTRALSDANAHLEELASTDVLTGLMNRRRALDVLIILWQKALVQEVPLACLMIDADGFKQINDSYGHDAGDAVLCELARELTYAVRTDDFVCRLGGDEFLVICPGTDHGGALHLAKQVHRRISTLKIPAGTGYWQGSLSIGVAVRDKAMSSYEELIKLADRSVYAAKGAGRNCVRSLQ
ncbi:MAG TPA: GGDEF domain-containing protein, partial [Pelovirga sp.]|nr:GGDEF domain-containing protein [Pelovirga sp.]